MLVGPPGTCPVCPCIKTALCIATLGNLSAETHGWPICSNFWPNSRRWLLGSVCNELWKKCGVCVCVCVQWPLSDVTYVQPVYPSLCAACYSGSVQGHISYVVMIPPPIPGTSFRSTFLLGPRLCTTVKQKLVQLEKNHNCQKTHWRCIIGHFTLWMLLTFELCSKKVFQAEAHLENASGIFLTV